MPPPQVYQPPPQIYPPQSHMQQQGTFTVPPVQKIPNDYPPSNVQYPPPGPDQYHDSLRSNNPPPGFPGDNAPYGGDAYEDRVSYPRLYIGKFGRGTTKRDLINLFQQYGEIVDTMVKDEYAFIEFSDLKSAGDALEGLDGTSVKGSRIIVEESKPRNNDKQRKAKEQQGIGVKSPRLYVGKISGVRKQELERLFERFGTLVDCMVQKEADYGFVEYESCEQAQRAMQAMHHYKLNNSRLIVEESKPRNDGQPRGAPPSGRGGGGGGGAPKRASSSEYAKIRGLPFNYNRDELFELVLKEVKNASLEDLVLEFDIMGKFSGSAYFRLKNPDDIRKLKNLEKLQLGKRYIEVIPVDQEDYDYGLGNNIPTDPRINKRSETPQTTGLIRLRGIPYKCTEEQIRMLFDGFQMPEIKILKQADRAAGEALVIFSSKEAAVHSLNWEGQQIEGRYVEITLSNHKEYESFRNSNWDVNIIKGNVEREEKRLKDARAQRSRKNSMGGSGGRPGRKDSRGGGGDRGDRGGGRRGGGGNERSRSARGGRKNSGEECYNCGSYNHISRDCPDRVGGDGECYKCGQKGHKSRDCNGGGRNGGRPLGGGGDRGGNRGGGGGQRGGGGGGGGMRGGPQPQNNRGGQGGRMPLNRQNSNDRPLPNIHGHQTNWSRDGLRSGPGGPPPGPPGGMGGPPPQYPPQQQYRGEPQQGGYQQAPMGYIPPGGIPPSQPYSMPPPQSQQPPYYNQGMQM